MKKIGLSILTGMVTFALGFFLARQTHSTGNLPGRGIDLQSASAIVEVTPARPSDYPSEPLEFISDTVACPTPELFPGEVLRLSFKMPHGPEMAIKDPDENLFMVCYESGGSPTTQPLLNSSIFQQAKEVKLITNQIFGTTDYRQTHRVFQKTGWYTIFVSTNFKSCDFPYDGKVRVYYSNTAPGLSQPAFR